MRINIPGQQAPTENPQGQKKSGVVVSPHPTRTRVFLDMDGNEIDPRTKKIIKKNTDQ